MLSALNGSDDFALNGDGIADLIVGAAGADPNGDWSGQSYVVFGKASGPAPGAVNVVMANAGS